ncbi:unnamed protein product [Protopolystoma xenopodis]|uniref:Uncharacterized protein n=1 Tax=Protopolystoma xenopodis TaxID=117903 RepID=A0A448XEE5_9PLAT|nr:unnamed protein product [Protopolystoma xenopodis]
MNGANQYGYQPELHGHDENGVPIYHTFTPTVNQNNQYISALGTRRHYPGNGHSSPSGGTIAYNGDILVARDAAMDPGARLLGHPGALTMKDGGLGGVFLGHSTGMASYIPRPQLEPERWRISTEDRTPGMGIDSGGLDIAAKHGSGWQVRLICLVSQLNLDFLSST